MTTFSSGSLRRLGLGAAVAAATIALTVPTAAADDPPVGYDAPLTVSSDNGQWSVGSTYTLTVTANPPTEGTVRFCITGNGFSRCSNPIPTQNGIATMSWKPTRQGSYTIDSQYANTKVIIGSTYPTIRVYCPGHQGMPWNC